MNINDIEKPEEYPKDIMAAMFDKQIQLAIKYQKIEKMGNLLKETATNVDTPNGQKWIKDFAWRVTEELAEAQEAFDEWEELMKEEMGQDTNPYAEEHYTHYLEELIDALHFLIELTIIAGYDKNIVTDPSSCNESWDVVYQLGLMCNCLKNKPWKQTHMLTDRVKFEKYLKEAWRSMMGKFLNAELTHEDIYDLYFKKNAVNQFRQRSKY